MKTNLNDVLSILSRTPAVLDTLLRGLPEAWLHANEGSETWSPFDVVGTWWRGSAPTGCRGCA
jgi:hypothetical protein